MFSSNKKKKKKSIVGAVPNSIKKIVKIEISLTPIYTSWPGTFTSIKYGGAKLVWGPKPPGAVMQVFSTCK